MKLARINILAVFLVPAVVVFTILSGCSKVQTSENGQLNHDSEKAAASTAAASEKAAIDRARQTVKMLDDIYKGGIVKITDKYVTEDSEIPAGTAFKEIFAIAKDKGWHEARLLDVTGTPYNDENVAIDDFEIRAVKKIADGTGFYEEIEEADDGKYFRAMTAIPVVMEKCIWCHSNYEDLPDGQAIGAMGYRLKIESE